MKSSSQVRLSLLFVVSIFLLVGCGDGGAAPPDAASTDAGSSDAGSPDGGAADAEVIDTPAVTVRWDRVLFLAENPGDVIVGDYYFNPSHYVVGWDTRSHEDPVADPYPNLVDLSATAVRGALRWSVGGFEEGQLVYARVRAVDSEDGQSDWSVEQSALATTPERFAQPTAWVDLPSDASAYPYLISEGGRGYRFTADLSGANAIAGDVFSLASDVDDVIIDINGHHITFADSAPGTFVDFSYSGADRWTIYDSRDRLGQVRNGAYQPQSGERVALVYANGPIGEGLNVHHLDGAITGIAPGAGAGWIFNLNNALLPRPTVGPQIHHNRFAISGGESMGLIQAEARHSGTELAGRVFGNELLINGVTLEAGGRFRPFGVAVGGGEAGVIHGVEIASDTGTVTVHASRAVIYDMATSDGDAARRHGITDLTCSGGLVSVTTALAHGYSSGDTIIVEGATPQSFNGPQGITVTGAGSFEFPLMTCPAASAATLPQWALACYRRGSTLSLGGGEVVALERVRGLEELNHRFYEVGEVSDYSFTLLGVDGRSFTGAYEGGGRYVVRGEWEVFDNVLRVDAQSEEVQGIANGLAGYTHDNLVQCDATHSRMLQADGPSWTAILHNDVTMDGPPGAEIGTAFRLRYVATHTAFGFNRISARGPAQSALSLGSSQSGPEPEWRPQYFYEYRNHLSSQEAVLLGYGAFDDSHSWDSVYVLDAPTSAFQAALVLGGSEHGPSLYGDMDTHFHRNHFYRVSFEGPDPGYEIRINGTAGVASTTELRFAGCVASGRVLSHDPAVDPISLEPDDPAWPPATRPRAPEGVQMVSGVPY